MDLRLNREANQMKAIYIDQINRKGFKSEITDLTLDDLGQLSSNEPEEIPYQEALFHVRDRMIPISPVTYEMVANKPKDICYSLLPGRGCLITNEGKVFLVTGSSVKEINAVSDIMGHTPEGALGAAAQVELDMLRAHTA